MIDTINGKDGSGTAYADAPTWIKNWERTGLITFNDKNGDGKMFYTSGKITDPNSANEVNVDRDIMVLANPEIADLPAWVIALVAAGGIAAALSTTAGLLLVISTSVSHDLLKRTLKPDITDKQELLAARLAAMIAIVISAYFGINPARICGLGCCLCLRLSSGELLPCNYYGYFL